MNDSYIWSISNLQSFRRTKVLTGSCLKSKWVWWGVRWDLHSVDESRNCWFSHKNIIFAIFSRFWTWVKLWRMGRALCSSFKCPVYLLRGNVRLEVFLVYMFHPGISDPGAMLEHQKSSAISETLSLKDSRRRHLSSLGAEEAVELMIGNEKIAVPWYWHRWGSELYWAWKVDPKISKEWSCKIMRNGSKAMFVHCQPKRVMSGYM